MLNQIIEMKSERRSESDSGVKYMKAYARIAQGLEVEHQSRFAT